jgi:pyruvate dehydrogenase phosphatase
VDRVPQQLLNSLKFKKPQCEADYVLTMKSSYMRVDEQFLNEHKHAVKTSAAGSCGVTVLVRNDTLYVCNLGDSRVLLGGQNSHELLTNDHNTKNEKERELVKQRTTDPMPIRGHAVHKVPGERIGGVLMVTRAFGDGIFKRRDMSLAPFIPHLPYITSEPEITVRKLQTTDRYAIISSDGLYEYFTPADVAAIVEKQLETTTDGATIAAALIEAQFEKVANLAGKTVDQIKAIPCRKEFMDDISIIVLLFSPPSPTLPITGRAAD